MPLKVLGETAHALAPPAPPDGRTGQPSDGTGQGHRQTHTVWSGDRVHPTGPLASKWYVWHPDRTCKDTS